MSRNPLILGGRETRHHLVAIDAPWRARELPESLKSALSQQK